MKRSVKFSRATFFQQAKNSHSVGRSHVNLSVGNHRRDEFVSSSEVVSSRWRRVAVVQFARQVAGIERVQHRWDRVPGIVGELDVLNDPYDRVSSSIGRDARRAPWISKFQSGLRY